MTSLYQITKQLLRQSPLTLGQVHRESGLPLFWLRKFSSGEIRNPSVDRVQSLYEFLSKKKLFPEEI
jgi:hypothetical protein